MTISTVDTNQPLPRDVEPGSPQAWATVLARTLREQSARVRRFTAYYEGNHPIKFASDTWREHYGGIFQSFSVNYCSLIPDAIAERLQVDGFRIGSEPEGDRAANEIWQRNEMDSLSDTAHVEALYNSMSFGLVWPDDDNPNLATITIEHPGEVIVAFNPNNRRQRVAALKLYRDPWGMDQYQLWTPNAFYRLDAGPEDSVANLKFEGTNPFGVVPIVPLVAQPRTVGPPISLIEKIIPIQDAINKIVSDVIVISEALALPLRYILGWIEESEAQGGDESQIIKAAKSAKELLKGSLLTFPDPETEVGQLPAANMEGHIGMARELVQHVATLSRIPFHYFLMNGGNFPSGESIYSADAGIHAVTTRAQRQLGSGWEEMIRTAFLIEGNSAQADQNAMEVIWSKPGTRSIAVEVDAALKKSTIGVPRHQLYEDLGYSPNSIARFEALRSLDELAHALEVPTAPVPGVSGAQSAQNGQVSGTVTPATG